MKYGRVIEGTPTMSPPVLTQIDPKIKLRVFNLAWQSSPSNLSRAGWPLHGEAWRVCSSFGALNDALSKIFYNFAWMSMCRINDLMFSFRFRIRLIECRYHDRIDNNGQHLSLVRDATIYRSTASLAMYIS